MIQRKQAPPAVASWWKIPNLFSVKPIRTSMIMGQIHIDQPQFARFFQAFLFWTRPAGLVEGVSAFFWNIFSVVFMLAKMLAVDDSKSNSGKIMCQMVLGHKIYSIRTNVRIMLSLMSKIAVGRWQIKNFAVREPPQTAQKMTLLAWSSLKQSENKIFVASIFWTVFGGASTTKFLL